MLAVDTNVLVRMLVRDDVRQARLADLFAAKGAWVSHLVLVEAMWVLSTVYERNPKQVSTAIEMLLDHKHLVLQEPETVMSALRLFRKRPALGFSDCLMLEVARKAGHLLLGTFDKNLGKAGGAQRLR